MPHLAGLSLDKGLLRPPSWLDKTHSSGGHSGSTKEVPLGENKPGMQRMHNNANGLVGRVS